MYQLVIFDWDGTLIDSAQKISNCIRAAAVDVGLNVPSHQDAQSIIGLSLDVAMKILFPEASNSQLIDVIERYKYQFVTLDETQQELFIGVEEGLTKLNEAGALLAIATGKSRVGMNRVFAKYGFENQFVASRCADETRSKPHPLMLEEILEFTSISPHKSIMVGDTSYDMEMAENAKMHGLGVSYGVHSETTLQNANAVDVLNSFNGVVGWLLDGRISKAFS
jgi:phosphoglycolate phosphatase